MKRIFYFDNIKGFLILCVVLGHTLGICANYYNYGYSWFKIISFFMMPLFIFITGKFANRSRKTPLKRSLKMLKIFIIAQILITLFYGYVLKIISPEKSLFIPRFTLWYLLTCSFLYLLEYVFKKFKFKPVFIISLIIALIAGFIKPVTNTLSLTRTITAIPFFALGYYSEETNILEKINNHKKIILALVIIISIWFLFNQGFFLFKDTYLKYNYFSYRTPLECFFKRCLLYVFFFIYSAFIINIMPKKKTLLANLGNKTLTIYLLHGVLLKTILHYKLFINNMILGTILTYVGIIIICLLIDYIIKNIKKLGGICFDKFNIKRTKEKLQSV